MDCAAAEAFAASDKKKLYGKLVDATSKYYVRLGEVYKKPLPPPPAEHAQWMNFTAKSAKDAAVAAGGAERANIAPRVIEFDEKTGRPLNEQEVRASESTQDGPDEVLPWSDWMVSRQAAEMGRKQHEMSMAQTVLYMLHCKKPEIHQPLRITTAGEQKRKVHVTEDMEAQSLWLPPCNPKSGRLYENSTHPLRVPIQVRETTLGSDGVVQEYQSERVFFIHPEFKAPELTKEEPAPDAVASEKAWTYDGGETMHPFWAVRRLTAKQMAQESIGFMANCELRTVSHSVVCCGACPPSHATMAYAVEVVVLTNLVALRNGDELIVEISETPSAKKREETWRDDVKREAKKAKTPKAAAAKSKASSSAVEI